MIEPQVRYISSGEFFVAKHTLIDSGPKKVSAALSAQLQAIQFPYQVASSQDLAREVVTRAREISHPQRVSILFRLREGSHNFQRQLIIEREEAFARKNAIDEERNDPAFQERVHKQVEQLVDMSPIFVTLPSVLHPLQRSRAKSVQSMDVALRAVRDGELPASARAFLSRRFGEKGADQYLKLVTQKVQLEKAEAQGNTLDRNARNEFLAKTQQRRERETFGIVEDVVGAVGAGAILLPATAQGVFEAKMLSQGISNPPYATGRAFDLSAISFHIHIPFTHLEAAIHPPAIQIPELLMPLFSPHMQDLFSQPKNILLYVGGAALAITATGTNWIIKHARLKGAVRELERSYEAYRLPPTNQDWQEPFRVFVGRVDEQWKNAQKMSAKLKSTYENTASNAKEFGNRVKSLLEQRVNKGTLSK